MNEKSMTITTKQKVALVASVAVSLLIGYKLGIKHEDKCLSRGIAKMWAVNPDLQPAMWDAINKIKK